MCMVGQLQWAVTLGRYDILAHVMSMSRFRLAPKVGHMERMKRVYGYLSRTKHYALGSELMSQTICTFQILSMIGPGSMVMSLKRYLRMPLNLLENQYQQLHSLMPTFCMTSSLEDLLLLSYTSST